MRWLDKRSSDQAKIYGIAAYTETLHQSLQGISDVWPDSQHVIADLPAAIPQHLLFDHIYGAHSVLIPVLPSEIDIYAASRLIAELMLITQLDRRDRKLAVVANRTRLNTKGYRMLMRFLASLGIPMISQLRDSQNFVYAASAGLGIYEMPAYKVHKDIEQMESIIEWLDQWHTRRLDAAVSPGYEHKLGSEVLTPTHLGQERARTTEN